MKSHVTIGLCIIAVAMLLPSYQLDAIARYVAAPLSRLKNPLIKEAAPYISFAYRKFDNIDCQKYLGRARVLNKGIQPIQIQIKNNTNRSLEFSLDTFNIPCISYLEVAHYVYFNTGLRLFWWGVGTLFIPILLVPFIMEAIESPRANARLERDYSKKALANQLIDPYGTINGLIFVAIDQFDPNFSFVLNDQMSNQKFELSGMNPLLVFEEKIPQTNS